MGNKDLQVRKDQMAELNKQYKAHCEKNRAHYAKRKPFIGPDFLVNNGI